MGKGRKVGGIKRVAAGAHLPTPSFLELAKRPDDKADYCLDVGPRGQWPAGQSVLDHCIPASCRYASRRGSPVSVIIPHPSPASISHWWPCGLQQNTGANTYEIIRCWGQ